MEANSNSDLKFASLSWGKMTNNLLSLYILSLDKSPYLYFKKTLNNIPNSISAVYKCVLFRKYCMHVECELLSRTFSCHSMFCSLFKQSEKRLR